MIAGCNSNFNQGLNSFEKMSYSEFNKVTLNITSYIEEERLIKDEKILNFLDEENGINDRDLYKIGRLINENLDYILYLETYKTLDGNMENYVHLVVYKDNKIIGKKNIISVLKDDIYYQCDINESLDTLNCNNYLYPGDEFEKFIISTEGKVIKEESIE